MQRHAFPSLKGINVCLGFKPLRNILDTENTLVISDEAISGKPFNGNYFDDFVKNVDMIHDFFNVWKRFSENGCNFLVEMGLLPLQDIIICPELGKKYQ